MVNFAEFDVITVSALVSAAVGPGGVFFFLVRKAINGSSDAIHRVESTVDDIRKTQTVDHDSLTSIVSKVNSIKEAQEEYHPIINKHSVQIGQLRARCDLIHKQGASHERE